MKTLLHFLVILLLASCGNFHGTNTSIWSDHVWLLPALTVGASAYFGYKAFKESKALNVPVYKSSYFIYSAALIGATIAIFLIVNGSK